MVLIKSFLLPVLLLAGVQGNGWLGIRLADANRATIEEVLPDSPAAKAGLRQGDVIVSVNGEATPTAELLIEQVRELDAGDQVRLSVLRGKERKEFKVRLAARPAEGREQVEENEEVEKAGNKKKVGSAAGARKGGPAYLGVELEERDSGVVVVDLVEGAPAARSGLRRGDKVQKINGKSVRNLDTLDVAMRGVLAGDAVRIDVVRGDRPRSVRLTAAARPGAKPVAETRSPAKSGAKSKAVAAPKRAERVAPIPKKQTPSRARGTAKARSGALSFSDSLEKSLAKARKSGHPLVVVFGAEWCVNCRTLKQSLAHSSLAKPLSGYERVWIDTDKQSALADKFKVESLPHTVFLTSKGKIRKTMIGYQPPAVLLPVLRSGLVDAPTAAGSKTAAKAKTKAKPKAAPTPATKARGADNRERAAGRVRAGRGAGVPAPAAAELKRLRNELRILRGEQAKQRALLESILKELRKKD